MSDLSADAAQILANLETVQRRIDAACERAGRAPGSVTLLPVTKTVPAQRLREAYAAGIRTCGENKVQEAKDKSEALADLPLSWSVIGHLQTNKAKYVARFADAFQALDSLKLAEALERRLEIEARTLDVFIQINTSAEESKFGLEPSEAVSFARSLAPFERLNVRGLMTLAIFSSDEPAVRACFGRLRDVQEQIRQDVPDMCVDELSMGMSGDFEWAIEEGATMVRVGQAIFGPRPTPDSDYWPGFAGRKEGQ